MPAVALFLGHTKKHQADTLARGECISLAKEVTRAIRQRGVILIACNLYRTIMVKQKYTFCCCSQLNSYNNFTFYIVQLKTLY